MAIPVASDPARAFTPFVVITIGNSDVFTTSDGILIDAGWSLSEAKKQAGCNFSVFDKTGSIADKYLSTSFSNKGIKLPDGFFEEEKQEVQESKFADPDNLSPSTPKANASNTSASVKVGTIYSGAVITTESAEVKAFLDTLALGESGDPSSLKLLGNNGYNVSYGGKTFPSFSRHPGPPGRPAGRYQHMYETFISLARMNSYKDFSPLNQDKAAIDLFKEKGAYELIKQGNIEAAIPKLGIWTSLPGKKEARWSSIAQFKKVYNAKLEAYKGTTPAPSTVQTPIQSQSAQSQAKSTQSQQKVVEAPKVETSASEQSNKGTQITIAVSIDPDDWAVYTYYHDSTEVSGADRNVVKFTGRAITGLLEQRYSKDKYVNISLKQLASQYCKSAGLKLSMDFEGPLYPVITQNGETNRRFLLKLCQSAGYYIWDEGPTLYIKRNPAFQNEPLGFIVRYGDNLDNISIRDEAQNDKKSIRTGDEKSTPTTVQTKTSIDTKLGTIEQRVLNTAVGTNKTSKQGTGVSNQPLSNFSPKNSIAGGSAQKLDPKKDYKEYTLNCEFTTTQAALTAIRPLTAFYVEGWVKFAEQRWFVEAVTHKYNEGGLRTQVSAYIPITGPRSIIANEVQESQFADPNNLSPVQDTSCPVPTKPTIIQKPAHPNRLRSRGNLKIDSIIMHNTVGSLQSTFDAFTIANNPRGSVAAHYVIHTDGTIYQMIPDTSGCIHAANERYNKSSIGIEHVAIGNGGEGRGMPEVQNQASAKLIRYLMKEYGISLSNILPHSKVSISGTQCPNIIWGSEGALEAWKLKYLICVPKVRTAESTPQGDINFINPCNGAKVFKGGGEYGDPRKYKGGGTRHIGIDFGLPFTTGSPIVASASGVVTEVGGTENLVSIKHNNIYTTRYLHNSKVLVKVGQRVKQGELIARVGNTSASPKLLAPHCHFDITKNGQYINPESKIGSIPRQ